LTITWPTEQAEKRQALLEGVHDTRGDIEANFQKSEDQDHLAQATADALFEAGLLGLKLPLELGGAEANPVTQMKVIAELAAIDTSAAWCTMVAVTSVGSAGAFLPYRGIDAVFVQGNHPMIVGVGMHFGGPTRWMPDSLSYPANGHMEAEEKLPDGHGWYKDKVCKPKRCSI
jgi:hypothetical protein